MQNNDLWIKTKEELLNEIHADYPKGKMILWRIGQCGYVIKFNGKIILIDPVLNDIRDETRISLRLYPVLFTPNDIEADFVICTHAHADHLAEETVKKFADKKNPPVFVVPAGCKKIMESLCPESSQIVYIKEGKTVKLTETSIENEIAISGISAAHPEHYFDENDERMALCYYLKLGNYSLIHLGDTYLTPHLYGELLKIPSPDVFFPPINGDDLFRKMMKYIGNMEAEEAAKLSVKIRAKTAIPTHYDMIIGNTADPNRFANEMIRLDRASNYKILGLGEKLIIQ